jgi:MFS family permease
VEQARLWYKAVAVGELRRSWPVLVATAAGNAGGMAALPIYSLSSFITPLQREFGWSRGAIGAAATIITVGIFVTGPFVGHFCDRHGVRALALPSMLLFAIAHAALTLINGSIATLYGGFVLLTIAGAATTSVTFTRVVNSWFDKARGLALGLTMTGSGITAFALPLLLAPVIRAEGWRAGFLTCGAIALLPALISWFLLHERRVENARTTDKTPPAFGMSAKGALRTRHFWTMVAAAIVFSSSVGGVIVHIVPLLGDIGLSAPAAARTASLLGVGIVAGRLLTGALLDALHGPLLAAFFMLCAAAGFLILYGGSPRLVLFAVLLIGLSLGSEGDLLAFFTARYFGMRSYAELFGWMFGFIALGTSAGPLLIMGLQEGGGYRTALLVFAGQCVVAAALFGSLGRYPVWTEQRQA